MKQYDDNDDEGLNSAVGLPISKHIKKVQQWQFSFLIFKIEFFCMFVVRWSFSQLCLQIKCDNESTM